MRWFTDKSSHLASLRCHVRVWWNHLHEDCHSGNGNDVMCVLMAGRDDVVACQAALSDECRSWRKESFD
jgi:hypothetical protein